MTHTTLRVDTSVRSRGSTSRELTDRVVAELAAADTLVVGFPVDNFGIPAALKTWVDLITAMRSKKS